MKQRRPKLKMLFSFIATFLCGVMLIQTPHMYVSGAEHTHDTKASEGICYNYFCHTWQNTYHACPVCNGNRHLGYQSCTTCGGTGGISSACSGTFQYCSQHSYSGSGKCGVCGASYSYGSTCVYCNVCGRHGTASSGASWNTGEGTTDDNKYNSCHNGGSSSGIFRQGGACADFPKNCPTCGGTGNQPCDWCEKVGYVLGTCGICNGNYTNGVPCSRCENGIVTSIDTSLCSANNSFTCTSIGQIDSYSYSSYDSGYSWTVTGYIVSCNGCGASLFGALQSGSGGSSTGGGYSISNYYLYPSRSSYQKGSPYSNYLTQGSGAVTTYLTSSAGRYITHSTTVGATCPTCGGDSLVACTTCSNGKQYQVTKGNPVCNKVAINVIQR